VSYAPEGWHLQRLFSTFASGWPGFALFIQRLLTGILLVHQGLALLTKTHALGLAIPEIVGAVAGLFILAGLWTPIAGVLVAAVELWIALTGGGNVCTPIILAVLGGTLAMIGPGAWSFDARLFGRKHLPR
jgi:putative oxidoreductase